MTTSSATVIEIIAARLRDAARNYNSHAEEPPAAALWTDPEEVWQPALKPLKQLLPELLVLGPYAPGERQGPVIWLKTALGGKAPGVRIPSDKTPVLYLPGVARHQLRNADQCPWDIQPLAELLFRGVSWTQRNGRDWTAESFFRAEDGLGLDLARDDKTRLSLRSALGTIVQSPVSRLQGRRLEASDFDELVIGDTPRDLLAWIGRDEAVRAEWGEERWHAFRSRCRDQFDFDPDKQPPIYAAERLGLRESDVWKQLWSRFCEAPAMYEGVKEKLAQAQPTDRLSFDREPWPGETEKHERELEVELSSLEDMADHEARQKLAKLEEAHGERRQWVWAKLGDATLAKALEPLHALAEATRSIPSFSELNAFTDWYASAGYEADLAALDALLEAGANQAPIRAAIRSVYLPWLQAVCEKFQQLAANGLPAEAGILPGEGECALFVDGLRIDLARRLAEKLEARSFDLEFDTRYGAIPTVTATAKPAVSPISGKLSGEAIRADFAPTGPDGNALDSHRFAKLLQMETISRIDEPRLKPPDASARGWLETGRIDARGHDLGAELAGMLPAELDRVAETVERLLEAGWKAVRIVTDHGWLLAPGGLEKFELPGYLVESRWSRCACIRGESVSQAPTFAWRWNAKEYVAVAPGATSFKGGVEYAHGGVSPQECILPVITVERAGGSSTSPTRVASLKWKGLRCHVEVANAIPGLRADARREGGDPASSIVTAAREVETDGHVSLLVPDEEFLGEKVTIVLLSESNQLVAKADTAIGG